MDNKNCICSKCEKEITRGDRFIILSMDTAEFYCQQCFIKHELVILDVDKNIKEQFEKIPEENEEINKLFSK